MLTYTSAHELAHTSEFRNDVREMAVDAAYNYLAAADIEENTGQVRLKGYCSMLIKNPDGSLEAMSYGVARIFAAANSYAKADAEPVVREVIQRLAGLSNAEIEALNE